MKYLYLIALQLGQGLRECRCVNQAGSVGAGPFLFWLMLLNSYSYQAAFLEDNHSSNCCCVHATDREPIRIGLGKVPAFTPAQIELLDILNWVSKSLTL